MMMRTLTQIASRARVGSGAMKMSTQAKLPDLPYDFGALEPVVRTCTRAPLSAERLGR
jgi:hypothetical protein